MKTTSLITTSLELLGALLLVAAIAVLIGGYSLPGALAAAGAGLIGVSWVVTRAGRTRTEVTR